MTVPQETSETRMDDFSRQAALKRSSFLSDYLYLLRNNKKWWMLPLLALLLAMGALVLFSSTGVAPLIYTLF